MFTKINSHNEWNTLKEVIVGDAKGTRATLSWDHQKKITKEKLDICIHKVEGYIVQLWIQ